MGFFFKKSSIYNVRMVITEEKILSNIMKIKKLINPNSKKQIIKLKDDSYFRDLVESVTAYLYQYPKKRNFPLNVYTEAYNLVEYATNEFENNNQKIEHLLELREENIKRAYILQDAVDTVRQKEEGWIEKLPMFEGKFTQDIASALTIIANSSLKTPEEVEIANKMINTKIANLESNLFVEIDIERIEDSSKALSYIGIEIAEALKSIPVPINFERDFNMFEEEIKLDKVELQPEKLNIIEPINNVLKINNNSTNSENVVYNIQEFKQEIPQVNNFTNFENNNIANSEDDFVNDETGLVSFDNLNFDLVQNNNVQENYALDSVNIENNNSQNNECFNKNYEAYTNFKYNELPQNNRYNEEPNISNNYIGYDTYQGYNDFTDNYQNRDVNYIDKESLNFDYYDNHGSTNFFLNENGQLQNVQENNLQNFYNETRMNVKPSFLDKIKNTKFGRMINNIFNTKIILEYPVSH